MLFFTPFAEPSYIPLGIAQLKSYIERELPSARVFNLDINNQFYGRFFSKAFLGKFMNLCKVCPKKCKRGRNGQAPLFLKSKLFQVGFDCLKNNESNIFYDVAKYNYFTRKIKLFIAEKKRCIDVVAKEIIQKSLPIPAVFEDLFEEDVRSALFFKPDLLGFSVFSYEQLFYSVILAKIIKNKFSLPVVFGGAFMSHVDVREFLGLFDFVDFVISGEGEKSLVELGKNLIKKKFDDVPGLWYRKDRKISCNRQNFIENLDCLPYPDFSDFKLNRYLFPSPVLPVNFSRGCYWRKCTFCTYHNNYPESYKTKSIKKFVDEIKYYNKQGIRHFFIVDDVISAPDLDKISSELIKKKIKMFFGAIVRAERGFSCKVLKNIYSAGGRVLVWGVETSCQKILRLMKKGTTVGGIKTVLKFSKQNGFYNHLFMIRGFPTQTEQETKRDIYFLKNNQKIIDSFCMHEFQLLGDSYIFHNLKKFKLKDIKPVSWSSSFKSGIILHSNAFNYKSSVKLNRKRIGRIDNEILKNFGRGSTLRYYDPDHSLMLLHASRNSVLTG